ncbi:RNA polymerase sigma factor [Streptomyces mirabilis]|uniref:RNA polymerase sigma factor n=1 Tax=Streptomyces mirabilis TaxID=68239 RepID=UPI0036982511
MGGTVTLPAWRTKPSFYLVATDDRMIPPPAQRAMAERAGATVSETGGSHAVHVSKTDEVAALMMPLTSPTDEELARGAQAGETGALGLLLARHQAAMRAVAMSLLGYGPDAEDVVQDAALTALRRIGDVRDPAAVGAWLRAVVRNAARMRPRVARETPGLEHAMRDWIWDAVEELPEQLRLVLMLRHFCSTTRSGCVLLSTAAQAHDDASVLTEGSRQEALATLHGAARGNLPRETAELWPTETELVGALGRTGERTHPFPAMRRNQESGVRQHLRHVVAGRDITIWEMDVINPVGAVSPCPPTLAWLMFRRDRGVQRLRVVFPEPPR